MADVVLLDERASARDQQELGSSDLEATAVAELLMRAGIDHASSLWFQLLESATQQACDWAERAAQSSAPLSPRAAAVLGLRSLAADLLSQAAEQHESVRAAAEACLEACAGAEAQVAAPPARRRRWGEGAVPQPTRRSSMLDRSVGCC